MLRVIGGGFDTDQSFVLLRENVMQETTAMGEQELKRRLAEAVRDACLKAARDAYENAGVSGLCEEGRWECAVAAIRSLDLQAIIDAMPDDPAQKN
jgi:hypothetical protein